MPLDEEGNKWSCEPCVRGHRSSKCQHFDRLMMKVPKAGRPLAKCPHPKGTCSCQKLYALMVRIPKGSSCVCRPVYQLPMVVSEAGKASQSAQTPNPSSAPSPTVSSPNRVQKRPRRQNSVTTPLDIMPKSYDDLQSISSDLHKDMIPGLSLSNPETNPQRVQQYQSAPVSPTERPYQQLSGVGEQPQRQPLPSGQTPAVSSQTNGGGGCCSSKKRPEPQPAQSGSCCSGNRNGHIGAGTTQSKRDLYPIRTSMVSEAPGYFFNGHYHYPGNKSASTNELSSRSQDSKFPLLQQRNANVLSNFSLPNSVSEPTTGYSSPHIPGQPSAFNQQYATQSFPSNSPMCSETNGNSLHVCNCGEGCQCLGCATHPYNATTRQHIQEMGLMALQDDDQSREHSEDRGFSPYEEQPMSTNLRYPPFQTNGVTFDHSQRAFHDTSNGSMGHFENGTMPSFHDSTAYGNEMMQPSAYYTLEYPLGLLDPCTNLTGTCECGSNCQCVGCLTHGGHNGVSLQSLPQQDNLEANPDKTVPHQTAYMSTPTYGVNGNTGGYHHQQAFASQDQVPSSRPSL